MFDLSWSQSEKRIARRAFEQALDRELTALIQETKKRINQVSTPDELWEVEHWLTERRTEINKTLGFECLFINSHLSKRPDSLDWSIDLTEFRKAVSRPF